MPHRDLILFLLAVLSSLAPAGAMDVVTFRQNGEEKTVSGKILVEASDGGLLLASPDGVWWTVQPEDFVSRTTDSAEFKPLTPEELSERLRGELPPGFEVHRTNHYLVCFYTSRAYAEWAGSLFERLYMAFTNFWKRRGIEIHEPEFPLVAVVFDDRRSFARFSAPELGPGSESVIGYYSMKSNRMTIYDLTGVEGFFREGDRRATAAQVNLMLSRPEAHENVSTVVHEATHQIAYNCGLQTRFSDVPLWVGEGLAVYFETPDLSSAKGWKGIGNVHPTRYARFRSNLRTRDPDSLETLISDDVRFRESATALNAYAEAWALNYFLIKQHPKEFNAYMKKLSEKSSFIWNTPEERLAEFTETLGMSLEDLDKEFIRYMTTRLK
jgi:hypothetical protein